MFGEISMARRVKPRRSKPYRSRAISTLGGLTALAVRQVKQTPLSPEEQAEALTDYYTAIDALLCGRAQFAHFEKLVYAANVTRVLADMGIGDEYEEIIHNGMAAVQRIHDRQQATGHWEIDGDGCSALYAMEDLHRAQLEIATHGELEAALKEMWRRIKAGMKFQLKKEAA
jgi:hypothetical protein